MITLSHLISSTPILILYFRSGYLEVVFPTLECDAATTPSHPPMPSFRLLVPSRFDLLAPYRISFLLLFVHLNHLFLSLTFQSNSLLDEDRLSTYRRESWSHCCFLRTFHAPAPISSTLAQVLLFLRRFGGLFAHIRLSNHCSFLGIDHVLLQPFLLWKIIYCFYPSFYVSEVCLEFLVLLFFYSSWKIS